MTKTVEQKVNERIANVRKATNVTPVELNKIPPWLRRRLLERLKPRKYSSTANWALMMVKRQRAA